MYMMWFYLTDDETIRSAFHYYLILEGLDGVGDLVQGGPVNQLQSLTTVRHSKMCKK